MAHPQLKLTYFDFSGRAEITRLVLHHGGIPFTDERVAFPKFAEIKPTLPLGQLPVLEVDGKIFSQSIAIARYAAKLTGVYPTEPVEALRVDMIVDSLCELMYALIAILFHEKDEIVKAEKTKQYLETALPKGFMALESMVQGKFFQGEKVSLADFVLFDFVTNSLKAKIPAFSVGAFEKLSAVVTNVQAFPAIATYIAEQNAIKEK
jgi:glutathione S-transferase